MRIEVLLPSRKRPEALAKSIESLRSKATKHDISIMARFDDDDMESYNAFQKIKGRNDWAIIGPRFGYKRLHEYVNELCSFATGEWLFLWNDDALMSTTGWDERLDSYKDNWVILNPRTNHESAGSCIFPIVPTAMVNALGHFSLNCHNDTWMEFIGRKLQIMHDVDIEILHDRVDLTGGNDDETAREREYDDEFFSDHVQQQIENDVERLRNYI